MNKSFNTVIYLSEDKEIMAMKKNDASPFKCEVIDPKSVRVIDIGPVVIGTECSLTVDVADAGHGALSVMVKTSGQEVILN